MSRRMQLPYKAYVTAFLQTDLFYLVWKERQFRSSDAVMSISFLWLVMTLPGESHFREFWSKNKPVYENAVTGI